MAQNIIYNPCVHAQCSVTQSCLTHVMRLYGAWPTRLLHLWDFPGKILEWVAISFSTIDLKKEINVFDYAWWLNYYSLISFDSFPLFLKFLTSLINLIPWLKFFHRWKACWGPEGREDHRCLFHFSMRTAPGSNRLRTLPKNERNTIISKLSGQYWQIIPYTWVHLGHQY